jgi:hypothetical protein
MGFMEWRSHYGRTMLHMKNRQANISPDFQKFACAKFGIGIISMASPIFDVLKSLLDVNKD